MEQWKKVLWVYAATDTQDLAERYDQWAGDYEEDLTEGLGYNSPDKAAELLAKYLPLDAKVLDAGAGTGLVGMSLANLGYQNLVAMDLSGKMLLEAMKKGVYQECHQMTMGKPLDFPTDSFDGVVSVGVLTIGHAPASSLDELVRVTKPGGYIVYTLRPEVYSENGFREQQAQLQSAGLWRFVKVTAPFHPMTRGEPYVYHQVWAYQVL